MKQLLVTEFKKHCASLKRQQPNATTEELNQQFCQFMSGIVWACSAITKNDGNLTPQELEKHVSDLAAEMGMGKTTLGKDIL